MNQPTSNHFDYAVASLLEWQTEARQRNCAFYSDALAHGEVSVIPDKEFTTRKSRCDCCYETQEPGIRKFRLKEMPPRGYSCFEFHVCGGCWIRIFEGAPMHELIIVQLPVGVTSLSVS